MPFERTIEECLQELMQAPVDVQPTEALYWLIGQYHQLPARKAFSLVMQAGIGHYPAYIGNDRFSVPHAIYAFGPDYRSWALFYIQWR